jgi:hypothetical protein
MSRLASSYPQLIEVDPTALLVRSPRESYAYVVAPDGGEVQLVPVAADQHSSSAGSKSWVVPLVSVVRLSAAS